MDELISSFISQMAASAGEECGPDGRSGQQEAGDTTADAAVGSELADDVGGLSDEGDGDHHAHGGEGAAVAAAESAGDSAADSLDTGGYGGRLWTLAESGVFAQYDGQPWETTVQAAAQMTEELLESVEEARLLPAFRAPGPHCHPPLQPSLPLHPTPTHQASFVASHPPASSSRSPSPSSHPQPQPLSRSLALTLAPTTHPNSRSSATLRSARRAHTSNGATARSGGPMETRSRCWARSRRPTSSNIWRSYSAMRPSRSCGKGRASRSALMGRPAVAG